MGNVVVSSGAIAYLGVFTAIFREQLVTEWQEKLTEVKVPTDIETATLHYGK